ncbi:MAG: Ig-like domain-containing protein [Gammaproteobacteria bacterium]|nr:Ig-like domain-containing protein [Gammaproteobacteria bacterium]
MDTNYYFCRKSSASVMMAVFLFLLFLMTGMLPAHVLADPHPGQSKNVVIIGGTALDCSSSSANNVRNGGCLPVTEPTPPVGLADFTFTAMPPADVNAANLASYDTAVLNVASNGMACNVDTLTASQKTDLVNFVKGGKKLIIYDSECSTQNYSWLPFPFTTDNPGALGEPGTLTILEENILSSKDSTNVHYIDAGYLGPNTDAVGDMNVMTTYNPNWCVDMSGTNADGVTGPVHTYAKLVASGKEGLIIYNGLDVDYMYPDSSDKGTLELQKIWVQELQQPMNPSGLPCGVTAVGITLNPATATNTTGASHTVTAEMKDLLGTPMVGTLVTFSVKTGPNAGATGTCSPADCKTDSTGKVSFTYASNGTPGIDEIDACYTNSQQVCSQTVTKEWKEAISTATTTYMVSSRFARHRTHSDRDRIASIYPACL